MLRAIEAIIEPGRQVRLLEPVSLPGACRALVTVLDEPAVFDTLLNERARAADWNRPEEEDAWQHLQEPV